MLNTGPVILAVGSNASTPCSTPYSAVKASFSHISNRFGCVVRASRLYRTPAVPSGAGPDFVNAALVLDGCRASPEKILAACHDIEAAFGRPTDRRGHTRWAPRVLDIDLIACGARVLPDPATVRAWIDLPPARWTDAAPDRLLLPHPRLQDRAFVLLPLSELAPDWNHPLTGHTVRQMLAALSPGDLAGVRAL